MWITKKKHNKIKEQLKNRIDDLTLDNNRFSKSIVNYMKRCELLENDVIMLNEEKKKLQKIVADLEIKITELEKPKKRTRKTKKEVQE